MNRKLFEAKNIQQAIKTIKQELGSEAMIINTRKINKKPLDPYAEPMIEVEVAIPESLKTNHGKAYFVESIKNDISDIKDMISIAGFSSGIQETAYNHFESVGSLASLLRSGMSTKLADTIIQKAGILVDKNLEKDSKSFKRYVMQQCLKQINTKDFFNRNNTSGLPHVAAFVGPTGVGKTTSIAKLAAMLSFKRKMKVGLISIDNYRIGAFEQLKVYASIMGLLCVQAYNAKDLMCALDRMKSMDMVLIDTAGHSHYDKSKIDEIFKLIKTDFRISTHLVLSVTSEIFVMKEAGKAFSIFSPDTLVFTKIDETKRCGKIFDQINDLKLPVSLIANGQKVPEDLIVPDKKSLLQIVLGNNCTHHSGIAA